MERGAKSAKAKVEARPTVTRRSRKVDSSTGLQLKQRLAEALEQHKAISEILQVISASPSDVQPVLDAVAERALNLCDAAQAGIFLVEEDTLRFAARFGNMLSPEENDSFPLNRALVVGRAVIDRETIHHADIVPLLDTEYPDARLPQQKFGFRALLGVPLMREDRAIGAIALWRMEARRFTDKQIALVKTFAGQAAIAIENVRLFKELEERNRDLTEALEQQTATSEILRVISQSQTDAQPVFETIAAATMKLCRVSLANVFTFDGDLIHLAAFASVNAHPDYSAAIRRNFPRPPSRDTAVTRAVQTGRIVVIPDVLEDPEYAITAQTLSGGLRSVLAVPLVRGGSPIGAVVIGDAEPGPFPDKQIALLQTFADQAVIAIENVRLFNETKEALEKQAAISEILQVISNSPGDVKPMLNAVAERAVKLCGATDATILLVEGEALRSAARFSDTRGALEVGEFIPLTRGSVTGRAVVDRAVIHVEDLAMASEEEFPVGRELQRRLGHHTALSVPLMREDRAIGAIALWRMEARRFSDEQVVLVKTFADQAAIAIENVRLFNETKEALEQQQASGEVLSAISSSIADTTPVFDKILASCERLFAGTTIGITLVDNDGLIRLGVFHGTGREQMEKIFPAPVDGSTGSSLAILRRDIVHYPDVVNGDAVPDKVRHGCQATGVKSIIFAPMLWEANGIGTIFVGRGYAGPFSEKEIALLKTFADQAVIAIENVRLFKELEARTQALTRSVGQLTALGEVGQAVSSTLELETVLKTIVSRAVQLTGLDGGSIYEYDERAEEFRLQAAENMPQDVAEDIRKAPTRKGDGALGRTAMTLEPTQVHDTLDDSYQSARKELLIRAGYRALLAVPLLREDHLLGGLLVNRNAPGGFAPEVVELLKTFATQSALAIQNARLFREIAEKGRQLEAASRHKSDFLASMSHELRTPLNAILGFNEMILGEIYGEVPASMKEPLADIQTSGKHLLRLINNVLDLAKIEAGRMELALADYSAQDTVESVRATLRPLAADKGLEFVATVPADLPLAYGDSGRITQCLMNLAGNSLKFTKTGKVEISVEARGDLLVYKVADTGIGIPPDKLDTVFAEFKQTDATIASEYGGTGLGLSISRKFIEMHGGRIWVESDLGRGSTFIFEIPLRVSTGDPA